MFVAADKLYRALLTAVTILLAVLTAVVSYQVIGRYVPFVPRALWTEEISRICLEWMVFLGAAIAVRRSDHFVIDTIPKRVQQRIAKPIQLLVLLLVGVAGVAIVVGGIGFADTGTGRTSTTSGIQMVWAYAAMPVAGACVLFFVVELLVRTIQGESLASFSERLTDEPGEARSERLPAAGGG